MRLSPEFREFASDLIAEGEGFEVVEPGRVYRMSSGTNSYVYLECAKGHRYNCYKIKKTLYAEDQVFSHALKIAKDECKIMDNLEDILDHFRDLDRGDPGDDFSSKAERW